MKINVKTIIYNIVATNNTKTRLCDLYYYSFLICYCTKLIVYLREVNAKLHGSWVSWFAWVRGYVGLWVT